MVSKGWLCMVLDLPIPTATECCCGVVWCAAMVVSSPDKASGWGACRVGQFWLGRPWPRRASWRPLSRHVQRARPAAIHHSSSSRKVLRPHHGHSSHFDLDVAVETPAHCYPSLFDCMCVGVYAYREFGHG